MPCATLVILHNFSEKKRQVDRHIGERGGEGVQGGYNCNLLYIYAPLIQMWANSVGIFFKRRKMTPLPRWDISGTSPKRISDGEFLLKEEQRNMQDLLRYNSRQLSESK